MSRITGLLLVALLAACVRAGFGDLTDGSRLEPDSGDATLPGDVQSFGEQTPFLDATPTLSCAERYSELPAPEDQICLGLPGICRIAVTLDGKMSCRQFCAQGGGTCVIAMGNDQGTPCIPTGFHACDQTGATDEICNCALPAAPSPTSCAEIFQDGWVCSEPGGVCVVAAPLSGNLSCALYCAAAGYTCTGATENTSELCKPTTSKDCGYAGPHSLICSCSPP